MNQTQRQYLIDKVKKTVKQKTDALEKLKLDMPSASNHVYRSIMNGTLKLQSPETILNALKNKALTANEGVNWLSQSRSAWSNTSETDVVLKLRDLIVLPEEYEAELKRITEHNKSISDSIKLAMVGIDTIEMRIQLASDKTLQKMINEVDDMGDLSLIDTKIKMLND